MPVITPNNWHQTLGVPPDASHDQIKRAFRRRVRACHPDLNRGSVESEAELKRIIEAYRAASSFRMKRRSERIEEAFRSAGAGSAGRGPDRDADVLNISAIRIGATRLAAVCAVLAFAASVASWSTSAEYRPVRVDAAVFLNGYVNGSVYNSSSGSGWHYTRLGSLR